MGPEHPDTAISLSNLGGLLKEIGQREEARPYIERALAITEKALGPEHPDKQLAKGNLDSLDQGEGTGRLKRILSYLANRFSA